MSDEKEFPVVDSSKLDSYIFLEEDGSKYRTTDFPTTVTYDAYLNHLLVEMELDEVLEETKDFSDMFLKFDDIEERRCYISHDGKKYRPVEYYDYRDSFEGDDENNNFGDNKTNFIIVAYPVD